MDRIFKMDVLPEILATLTVRVSLGPIFVNAVIRR